MRSYLSSGSAGCFNISGILGLRVICFCTDLASAGLITVWKPFMSIMAAATAAAFFLFLAVTGMALAKRISSSESSSGSSSKVGTSGRRFSSKAPDCKQAKECHQTGGCEIAVDAADLHICADSMLVICLA